MYNINKEQLIKDRRHFHMYPEVAFKEYETQKYILERLNTYKDIEIQTVDTSVIATIKGNSNKTIAMRCDIDALPMQELNDIPYKSTIDGVAHTCGHDTHIAMCLETLRNIYENKEHLNGTVKFIFQSGEEVPPGGAIKIVESGLVDDCEMFMGMHIGAGKLGSIGVSKDFATTSCASFTIHIEGKGSHGAIPQAGIDPIVVGSNIVLALQTIVSRNLDPHEFAVVSIGSFNSGTVPNVIPQSATIKGTVRTAKNDLQDYIKDRMTKICEMIASSYNAKATCDYVVTYPSIYNDPSLVELAKATIHPTITGMIGASEDFSYYGRIAKSIYFQLGGGESPYINHHPCFNIDEEAMVYGCKCQLEFIESYLNHE